MVVAEPSVGAGTDDHITLDGALQISDEGGDYDVSVYGVHNGSVNVAQDSAFRGAHRAGEALVGTAILLAADAVPVTAGTILLAALAVALSPLAVGGAALVPGGSFVGGYREAVGKGIAPSAVAVYGDIGWRRLLLSLP
jgi:hypothetical protein